MIKVIFGDEDILILQRERFYHSHPRVRKKMQVFYLKSQKIPHKEICRMVGITKTTLVSYLRDFCEGGVNKPKKINFHRPISALAEYETLIANYTLGIHNIYFSK